MSKTTVWQFLYKWREMLQIFKGCHISVKNNILLGFLTDVKPIHSGIKLSKQIAFILSKEANF